MATRLILYTGLPVLSEGEPVKFTPPAADPVDADVAYTDETVEGLSDGTITVSNPTGGLGSYQYSIGSGWQSSGNFTALAPGAYVVQVRDAADYDNTVTLETVTIAAGVPEWTTWFVWIEEEPIDDPITIEGTSYTHAALVADDFEDILVKYDNEAPHTVRMVGLLLPELVGSLSAEQLNTLHEVFDLWVYWSGTWNDNGVMKANRSVEGPAAVSASYTNTEITAAGANDGTITFIAASGGGGFYEYSINNGLNWQASPEFTGLGEDTYILKVRDSEDTSNEAEVGTVELVEPVASGLTDIELTTNIELTTDILI